MSKAWPVEFVIFCFCLGKHKGDVDSTFNIYNLPTGEGLELIAFRLWLHGRSRSALLKGQMQ
jgi:hypothetical protein